jgi:hypothetical protein
MKFPYIGFDGRHTALVLGPSKYIVGGPEYPAELALSTSSAAAYKPLEDYPVLRWIELYTAENSAILIPQSVKKVLGPLAADTTLQYTLDHFKKESIMATAKAAAAAKTTSAKAANAAKAPKADDAKAAKPAKGEATAAPAAKKAAKAPKAEAAPAAPAKQATKKGAAAADAGGEGRKGRPSPHALDAKIGKGKENFADHVREGSHRFNRYDFLVKNVGKTVGDVLGQEFEPGYPLVSKHITSAVEEGYITLSK